MLSAFVGKNCGSGWREEGLAELVLDEVAKMWKRASGGVIVEDKGDRSLLKTILQGLESNMSGGKVVSGKSASAKAPLIRHDSASSVLSGSGTNSNQTGLGMATRAMDEEDDEEDEEYQSTETRKWIKVIGAYEQPRLLYNVGKKHFERSTFTPLMLAPVSRKTTTFRDRYHLVYQRLLRNETFQTPSAVSSGRPSVRRTASATTTAQQSYSITPIANLLGRHGTFHLLLGLLGHAPTGGLSISDLSGTIVVELDHAQPVPFDGAWFAPGMIVLVHGIYEEEENPAGFTISGNPGVGGTIGGRFVASSISGPSSERRETSLGTNNPQDGGDLSASGGFGWVDFLGVGSERALGPRMRKVEKKCLRADAVGDRRPGGRTIAILSDIHLDNLKTPDALNKLFSSYDSLPVGDLPVAFIMIGNFVQRPAICRGGSGGSIEYKEYFDSLASVLTRYPLLLRNSTFIFVPGDHDAWASTSSSGAAIPLPREPVPDIFTSRIKRAFDAANSQPEIKGTDKTDKTDKTNKADKADKADKIDKTDKTDEADKADKTVKTDRIPGEAQWTSNPCRLSIFGPVQEIVVFRDDISKRFWRHGVEFFPDGKDAESTSPKEANLDDESVDDAQTDKDGMEIDTSARDAESHIPETKEKSQNVDPPSKSTLRARKLVKSILDQGNLVPFPTSIRPIFWDFASSLNIYPLPTTLILADSESEPFAITYEGCHVVNPGPLLPERTKGVVQWAELDLLKKRGKLREERF